MSFFNEGQEVRGPAGSRGIRPALRQTIILRRAVAAGLALLVLLLLVLGIRGCLNAREDRAFRDYASEVRDLVGASNEQSKRLFDLLSKPKGGDALDVQTEVSAQKVDATELVDRAKRTDHPDELGSVQDWIVATLEFRRDGLEHITQELPTALGEKGRAPAINTIAGQMQVFLASDVIYSQRALPGLRREFQKRDLTGEKFPTSQFLPDLSWLDPDTVDSRLSRIARRRPETPGIHGTGLQGVTAKPSGSALTEGVVNRIPASAQLAFDVQVQNQGQSEETDVAVSISIRDGNRIDVEQRINRIAAGDTETVTLPISRRPTTGTPSQVRIDVAPVPGEEVEDNNKAAYRVVFTR